MARERSPGGREITGRHAARAEGAVEEEVLKSARRDPRAEPEAASIAPPSIEKSPSRAETTTREATDDTAAARTAETVPPPSATTRDPRFAEVERLLGRNAWQEIIDLLSPQAATLPPGVALILALAQREVAGEASAGAANALAIESMAELLGVSPGSHTALVLAKRLLRQPPASWRTKPAPPARFTVPIILIVVALGLAAGWFASNGSLRF